jgi:hypothetical protein
MAMTPHARKRSRRRGTTPPSTAIEAQNTTSSVVASPQQAEPSRHVPSVEERLRVCLTLINGVHCFDDIADAQEHVHFDGIQAEDLRNEIPNLADALRQQVLAIREALPSECLNHEAPPYMPRPKQQKGMAAVTGGGE